MIFSIIVKEYLPLLSFPIFSDQGDATGDPNMLRAIIYGN